VCEEGSDGEGKESCVLCVEYRPAASPETRAEDSLSLFPPHEHTHGCTSIKRYRFSFRPSLLLVFVVVDCIDVLFHVPAKMSVCWCTWDRGGILSVVVRSLLCCVPGQFAQEHRFSFLHRLLLFIAEEKKCARVHCCVYIVTQYVRGITQQRGNGCLVVCVTKAWLLHTFVCSFLIVIIVPMI
jgi:hypothetical protein